MAVLGFSWVFPAPEPAEPRHRRGGAGGEALGAAGPDQEPQGFWPVQNHGELAVLYRLVFLYIASRGGGTLTVTHD